MDEQRPPVLQLPVPVSFFCLGDGSDGIEHGTEVLSIFQNGFVIRSPRNLLIGSALLLRLRIPGEQRTIECAARVTSEQAVGDRRIAYKVEVETGPPQG